MSDHSHHEPNGESTTIKELIIGCAVVFAFTVICFLIMLAGML
tara:strand:+ start:545 stop:673 length:129 start_codon:yes stop_codon:yes gene_type:complete